MWREADGWAGSGQDVPGPASPICSVFPVATLAAGRGLRPTPNRSFFTSSMRSSSALSMIVGTSPSGTRWRDRKSTRLNSSHSQISYAVFCLKKQHDCSFLRSQPSTFKSQPILLSYSYTALEPFRHAKSQEWKTVLVQIDPGPDEERIVAEDVARVPQFAGDWQAAPAEYWVGWRKECELADRIVVNSEWSRQGLMRRGVPTEKMSVIPLAYEPPDVGGQKSQA